MPTVLDYRYAPATPQQIKAAGAAGVIIYTKMEQVGTVYNALKNAGLPVAFVDEHTDNDGLQGYALGLQYGKKARAIADSVGHPHDRPLICASFDFPIQPGEFPVCLEHLRGFRDGAGPCAPYAVATFIDAAVGLGYCSFGMQVCSSGYSGNHYISANAALKQHCNVAWGPFPAGSMDPNDVLQPDWGQHDYAMPAPPAPKPVSQEDTMVPLVDGTGHGSGKLPVVYADGTQLIALYTTADPFVGGGVQLGDAWVLDIHKPILRVCAAPSREGVWALLEDHTVVAVAFVKTIKAA